MNASYGANSGVVPSIANPIEITFVQGYDVPLPIHAVATEYKRLGDSAVCSNSTVFEQDAATNAGTGF